MKVRLFLSSRAPCIFSYTSSLCEGLYRMLDSFPTRAAWALCTFAYSAGPGTEPVLFEGRTDGRIVPARGPPKFGWDPIFEAEDTGLTYVSVGHCAESGCRGLTKNAISADTRRWRRRRNMRFPTGDVRCRSCARTYKRRGEARHNHIGRLAPSGFQYPSDASHI